MIDPRDFAAAIQVAAKGADTRPIIPAYSMIRLSAVDGTLIVEASGERVTAGRAIPVVDNAVNVMVSAVSLGNVARVFGDGTVTLERSEGQLLIKQNRSVWRLPIYEDEGHTPIAPPTENGGTIPEEWFRKTLPKAQKVSASGANVHGVVLFDGGNNVPHLIGVSNWGAECWIADRGSIVGSCDIGGTVVPFGDSELTVHWDDRHCHIHDGDTWVMTSRDEIAKAIKPDQFLSAMRAYDVPDEIACDPYDIAHAVSQVEAVTERSATGVAYVEVSWGDDSVRVRSDASTVEFDAKTTGAGRETFNAAWLSRMLANSSADHVQIGSGHARVVKDNYVGLIPATGKTRT